MPFVLELELAPVWLPDVLELEPALPLPPRSLGAELLLGLPAPLLVPRFGLHAAPARASETTTPMLHKRSPFQCAMPFVLRCDGRCDGDPSGVLPRESFSVPPIVTDTIVPAAGMAQSLCPMGAIWGTGADI